MSYNSAAILMTSKPGTVNPLKPEGHWLHEAGMIGYVMGRGSDKREVWTSHGSLGDNAWAVGTYQSAHHDQSRRDKGMWRVVGVVRWNGNGNAAEVLAGEVPDRKIKHGVFK